MDAVWLKISAENTECAFVHTRVYASMRICSGDFFQKMGKSPKPYVCVYLLHTVVMQSRL